MENIEHRLNLVRNDLRLLRNERNREHLQKKGDLAAVNEQFSKNNKEKIDIIEAKLNEIEKIQLRRGEKHSFAQYALNSLWDECYCLLLELKN